MENNLSKLSGVGQQYHNLIVGGLLVFVALFINMGEAAYERSLRNIFTVIFAYFLGSNFLLNRVVLTRASFNYILFLVGFTFCYYLFGSANNLIIHLLTISLGTVLFFNGLLASNIAFEDIWGFAKKIWCVIYFTLVVELILVMLGYQPALYAMFPEENRQLGLPAYRSLNNTFAVFFDLNFTALNSVTLQAQAYGQFCVMLTILGFSYTRGTFSKSSLMKALMFLAVPLSIYTVTPNVTAGIIFVAILAYVLAIKRYLRVLSLGKFLVVLGFLFTLISFYYLSDLGFVRKYSLENLYDFFLEKQIDYMLAMSISDWLLGLELNEYHLVNPTFEIGYLSYLLVSGALFAFVNLVIFLKFMLDTVKQAKLVIKLVDNQITEIQLTNALFALTMFLSSMHFPIITNYLGTLIFVFHLAFGFYILKINREWISQVQLIQADIKLNNVDATPRSGVGLSGA